MPLLWRYLLKHFLKVFVLCVVAFIAILLTMRLEEIAYFATLGPQGIYVLWFTLQQIPYILPIAFPVAALISSTLLFQRLSTSHELTAMRACGFALKDILAPIIAASLFLSALNFYIISELSTASHLNTAQLKNQLRSVNPLLLLQNKHLMRMKGFYFEALGASRVGEFANEIVFASLNNQSQRMSLLVSKKLEASPFSFTGYQTCMITGAKRKDGEKLMIENIEKATTTTQDFSLLIEKKIWSINNDHLQLPQLLVRLNQQQSDLTQGRLSKLGSEEIRELRRARDRSYVEIIRRASVGFAVFSFTLMGAAFGMSISRHRSRNGILVIIALATLYLTAFFTAKGIDYALVAAALLYLVPHFVILIVSLWNLNKITYGRE